MCRLHPSPGRHRKHYRRRSASFHTGGSNGGKPVRHCGLHPAHLESPGLPWTTPAAWSELAHTRRTRLPSRGQVSLQWLRRIEIALHQDYQPNPGSFLLDARAAWTDTGAQHPTRSWPRSLKEARWHFCSRVNLLFELGKDRDFQIFTSL